MITQMELKYFDSYVMVFSNEVELFA